MEKLSPAQRKKLQVKLDDLIKISSNLEKMQRLGRDSSPPNVSGEADPSSAAQEFDAPTLAVTDSRDGTTSTRALTEVGNAQRLFDLYENQFLYIADVKSWVVWRDESWRWDISGSDIRSAAALLSLKIYSEGTGFTLDQSLHFAKWGRSSQNCRTIDAAISLLSDHQRVRMQLSMIDADPMLVGFSQARQIIDLRTGIVRAASQSDYITKSLTPGTLGESAKAKRWHLFLDQIFEGNKELIDWLHRWCGYLLTGSTSEQFFLFLFGLGANGKSVFGELIKHVMGDYGRTVASETLTETKRQAGGATPDLADLIGCRLAMSSETEDGSALAEALIKSLTSGDTITARQLYSKPVQFQPAFKLLMVGNHRPVIRGNDYGIWRRVRLVPFTKIFTESERDPKLLDKLKAESPHILAWMIQGCLEWQRRGLADVPDVVGNQTAQYRQEQDVIGQWLGECTSVDGASEMETGELYLSYRKWATNAGLKPASKISIGRRLSERGYTLRQSSGKRIWCGLALKVSNYAPYRDEDDCF